MAYGRFKKNTKTVKQTVRKVARKTLRTRRKYQVVKKGKISSMGITKALADLHTRVNTIAEYKTIDQNHTAGSPDVTLREFYSVSASALQSTVSTTSTPGISGYFLDEITMPTRGDGLTNFDGKRYHVSSIQWKGTVYQSNTTDSYLKLFIVSYDDEDADSFNMSEFLKVDNNGEYSVQSKRNPDYKGYKIIGSKTLKLSAAGSMRRKDFNLFIKPEMVVKLNENTDIIQSKRFYCVMIASGDIATTVNASVNYQGNVRVRFIA